jgi:cation transport protein ChaC
VSAPPIVITREGLRDGSMLARVRANLLPGMTMRSDAEIEASLDTTLATHDPAQDIWLFAYGSLIWNPAIHTIGHRPALLRGWHRRFCFWLRMGRGSPEQPGLMLGLVGGGACQGIAWRIAAAEARNELLLVWRREMFGRAYLARWVNLATKDGTIRAVTFVANTEHDGYVATLNDEAVASYLATASGALGTCRDYLHQTVAHLHALHLHDRRLERLERLVEQQIEAAG